MARSGDAKRTVRRGRHGCAQNLAVQAPDAVKRTFGGPSDVAGLEPEGGLIAVLGAPGGAGAAHIVQFRAVGVEGAKEEAAEERLEAGGAGLSVPAHRRRGEGG